MLGLASILPTTVRTFRMRVENSQLASYRLAEPKGDNKRGRARPPTQPPDTKSLSRRAIKAPALISYHIISRRPDDA